MAFLTPLLTLLLFAQQASPPKQAEPAVPAPHPLDTLLKALNSEKEEPVRREILADWAPNMAITERLKGLMNLVGRAAPVKLLKVGPTTAGEMKALVLDHNLEQFTLVVKLDEANKITGVILTSPDVFDKKPVKETQYKDLASLASETRKTSKSPAIGLAVSRAGKREIVVEGVRKVKTRDKVTQDDPWVVGGIGRPICSSVVGALVDQGLLKWDTTLGDLVPEMLARQPDYASVTIDMLLRNRSGFPPDASISPNAARRVVASASTPGEMRENYAKSILGRKPSAMPGIRYAFSNSGYSMLAFLAETVAKKPYEQLVQELVFKPLGMAHSYVGVANMSLPHPVGHFPGDAGLQPIEPGGPLDGMLAGTGLGIYCSLGDLLQFGEAHLQGLKGQDGFLKAGTVQHLHALDAKTDRYACGWEMVDIGPLHLQGHSGSNGLFRSQLIIQPEADLVAVCFLNCGGDEEPPPAVQAVLAAARNPGAVGK